MFCFAVYMTNFCMEVFNCEISVIASQSISKLAYLLRVSKIVESSLTSSFELLKVFVDEMFGAEIYLLISIKALYLRVEM